MKRLIVALLLLSPMAVWAQAPVADSTAAVGSGDEGISAQPKSRHKGKPNVLGMPVYYDLNGNVIGEGDAAGEADGVYHRPGHHYLNSLADRYCTLFFEGELMVGAGDVAGGFNFTVLPRRWGAYGSALVGLEENYCSLGPALRLSGSESMLDWQLYGGLLFGERHLGAECGLRVAAAQRHGKFCWTSASLGMAAINGDVYMTIGASLDIMLLSWLTAVWF